MIKEFEQLDSLSEKLVVEHTNHEDITTEGKKAALKAGNIIKEKRNGIVKIRTCADVSKRNNTQKKVKIYLHQPYS